VASEGAMGVASGVCRDDAADDPVSSDQKQLAQLASVHRDPLRGELGETEPAF
jgi:hypothetical protein